jgi:hypothetical protein
MGSTQGGQRDYSRRRPDGSRMPKRRAIKGIDEDLKLNKALWHMAEVLRNGGLQAFGDVLLDRVQGGPEILCAISISAGIEQHRSIHGGFARVLPRTFSHWRAGDSSGVEPLSSLALEGGNTDTSAGRCSPTPRRAPWSARLASVREQRMLLSQIEVSN